MTSTPGDANGLGDPVAWLESVTLDGSEEPVRVVLDGREGHQVFLRRLDPRDGDDPPRVPVYVGDVPVMTEAISHLGHHLTPHVGRVDDLLTSARVVPVRREPGRLIARTLRHGEPDNGDRLHVRPGEKVTFEEGSIVVELEAIDAAEAAQRSDARYVPLTPALWTWLTLGQHDPAKVRYVLAAARRLDAASALFDEVERRIAELGQEGQPGPPIRRSFFALVSTVETAVVALSRVCDMVVRAS